MVKKIFFLILISFFSISVLHAKSSSAVNSNEIKDSTAAVQLGDREVIIITSKTFSLSARERAQNISDRILKISKNPLVNPNDITVIDREEESDIILDNSIIMSVTNTDANFAGLPRPELARKYAEIIKNAINSNKKSYNRYSIIRGIILALISILIFIFILKYIFSFYAHIMNKYEKWAKENIKGFKIQHIELLNAGVIYNIFLGIIKFLYLITLIILIYFYVPFLFSLFPWTKGLAHKIFDYILDPVTSIIKSFIYYIPKMIFIATVIMITRYIIKILKILAEEIREEKIVIKGFYPDWAKPTFQLIKFIIWVLTLVIIFPYLPGSDSPAFKGISVFLGILLSIGSSSSISNAVAGLIITYMRPFKVGDRVKISETVGDVVEKTLLVTRIKTIKNITITIPNALVLGSHIINYSSLSEKEGIILNTNITIGYDIPWTKVNELLISAAYATENVLKEPKPFVLQTALNDYHVNYELNVYTNKPQLMAKIYSDLHANIMNNFFEAGIEIMSPSYMGIRKADKPIIPTVKEQTQNN